MPDARRDQAEVRDAESATQHYISQRDDQPVLVYIPIKRIYKINSCTNRYAGFGQAGYMFEEDPRQLKAMREKCAMWQNTTQHYIAQRDDLPLCMCIDTFACRQEQCLRTRPKWQVISTILLNHSMHTYSHIHHEQQTGNKQKAKTQTQTNNRHAYKH